MMRLLAVPFDSGHRDLRAGAGPLHLLESGAVARLRSAGHDVDSAIVEPESSWRAEIRTAFELNRALAGRVRETIAEGRFPLVLAGNCNSALGTVAGILAGMADEGLERDPGDRVGVLWLDGHGDFHTPETTSSGFLDGTGLAALTGRCWTRLVRTIPGFAPLHERSAILVGAADTEVEEREALEHSAVTWLSPQTIRSEGVEGASRAAFDALAANGVTHLYVHIDLDAHHPSEGQANRFEVVDGLVATEVRGLVRAAASRFDVAAVALTSYDPSADRDGRMQRIAMELLGTAGELNRAR